MSKLKDSRGVTLVEIIVSIAILGIIVTPLATLFVSSVKNNVNARDRMIANQVAQKYMEEFMMDTISFINKYGDKKTFTDKKTGMTVKVDISHDNSFANNVGGNIEYDASFEANGDFSDNDTLIVNNNKIELGAESKSLNPNLDNINIEIKCNSNTKKTLIVRNKAKKPVKLYKAYSEDKDNKVTIKTASGEVYVYKNIYDNNVISENKNRLDKIIITVSKGTEAEILTELASVKTID